MATDPNLISDTTDNGLRRCVYKVDIPSDCEDDPERRFDLAVLQAREEASDWVMPANWSLVEDDGENVTVERLSNAT